MSGHPATPRQPAPHAFGPDPAAAPSLDAAFEGGISQNRVRWILGPISENPYPAWQNSLSENCANPIEYYFYRARYYEPDIGRFTQRDPIGYDGEMNMYTYVNNNPLQYTDPYGLQKHSSITECINALRTARRGMSWATGALVFATTSLGAVSGAAAGALIGGITAVPSAGASIAFPVSGGAIGAAVGFKGGKWGRKSIIKKWADIHAKEHFKICVENSCEFDKNPDLCLQNINDQFDLIWYGGNPPQ